MIHVGRLPCQDPAFIYCSSNIPVQRCCPLSAAHVPQRCFRLFFCCYFLFVVLFSVLSIYSAIMEWADALEPPTLPKHWTRRTETPCN